MGGYIIHFMVYTLAMSGLIFFALFVYKKVMSGSFDTKGAKMLSIEETLSINPRKSLMIVKAGEERFLVASDVDKTTLISKLEDKIPLSSRIPQQTSKFEDLINEVQNVTENKPQETVTKIGQKQPVHLEVISQKNPAAVGLNRKSVYTSKNYVRKKSHNPIRNMASKINEI